MMNMQNGLKAAGATLLLLAASGCSTMGVGKDEYACPGMPNGVACKSVSEMYELTENGNVPLGMDQKEKSKKSNSASDAGGIIEQDNTSASSGDAAVNEGASRAVYEPSRVTKQLAREYIAPNLGQYPIPIRTPAKVMRVWIAPFEDGEDLVMAGYVYTEIEPRRWVITEEGVEESGKGKQISQPLRK